MSTEHSISLLIKQHKVSRHFQWDDGSDIMEVKQGMIEMEQSACGAWRILVVIVRH